MKKTSNYTFSENSRSSLDKNTEIEKIKTTNVNILLNRVRLDKKREIKKRIYFSMILTILVSSLAVYFAS